MVELKGSIIVTVLKHFISQEGIGMHIVTISTIISSIERPVTVRVALPMDYETSGDQVRYPVCYLHDGQDLLRDEHVIWGKESLRFEAYYEAFSKFLPKVILVAIECPRNHVDRTVQYLPYTKTFEVPEGSDFPSRVEGRGEEYLAWIVNDLKPMIDNRFRTLADGRFTAMGGYSSGALISLYGAVKYPTVFSRLILMSPSVWILREEFRQTMESASLAHLERVYMDIGTKEHGRVTSSENFLDGAELVRGYLAAVLGPDQLMNQVLLDGKHRQEHWRQRFPDALRWIYREF